MICCRDCKFGQIPSTWMGQQECHRFPPTNTRLMSGEPDQAWPFVRETDFCGEFIQAEPAPPIEANHRCPTCGQALPHSQMAKDA
jgi:hypothetical protein